MRSRREQHPEVGVIMGSDTDLPTMISASEVLEEFKIPFEERIISAHRTPDRMGEYGRAAVSRGLKVIIAGAGGSAHLPGMTASETRLPVLGVALGSNPRSITEALGSMTGMPRGVPLAFMGVNQKGAANAGLEAVRILADHAGNEALVEAYEFYVERMKKEVEDKDSTLVNIGGVAYRARLLGEK